MATPIPAGYHSITPYLIVDNAAEAIAFYERAFGAIEKLRLPVGDRLAHAEVLIGDSHVMLADADAEAGARSPRDLGGSPVSLMLYVDNADAAFDRAVAAGATVKSPLQDQFYGDRSGVLEDPFGHQWTISTSFEEVAPDEMLRRMNDMMSSQPATS